jgi:hypothetical protein
MVYLQDIPMVGLGRALSGCKSRKENDFRMTHVNSFEQSPKEVGGSFGQ